MEPGKAKTSLYVKRSFGGKLNASFEFIKENWKVLLKFTVYLILPVCLIQAFSWNGLMTSWLSIAEELDVESDAASYATTIAWLIHYGVYMLVFMLGSIVLYSLVYALMRTYNEREGGLDGITLKELRPLLFANARKMLVAIIVCTLFMVIVMSVVVGVAFLTLYSLILTVPLFFFCCVPLALLAPAYLLGDGSLGKSFKRAFRLGIVTWGGVFLMLLVMGIIGGILQGVLSIPWYVAFTVKSIFFTSDAGAATDVSVGYSFFLYLLGIVQTFGMYVAMLFPMIGLAYQYGHASERVDNVRIEDDINNFDKF